LPYIENPHLLRDLTTNASFPCTARSFDYSFDWKTTIVATPFGHGGIDAHAGSNDWLAPRVVTMTLIHVYKAGETYKTVSNALEAVIGQGNALELTTVEEDGTIWLWSGLRLQKYDKKLVAGQHAGAAEYPLTFIAPDPQQRAFYKPGTLLLDNGRYLDAVPPWYLDTDPDNFLLTSTAVFHTINNTTGISPDYAPTVTLTGPMTAPIAVYYLDANGVTILSWAYNTSLSAGEILHVNGAQQDVSSTLTGSAAYAHFTPPAGTDLWGIIRPGLSSISVQCAGVASPAAASVDWAPRK